MTEKMVENFLTESDQNEQIALLCLKAYVPLKLLRSTKPESRAKYKKILDTFYNENEKLIEKVNELNGNASKRKCKRKRIEKID